MCNENCNKWRGCDCYEREWSNVKFWGAFAVICAALIVILGAIALAMHHA